MFLFYVLSFFKKGDTIQGGTLLKEIRFFHKKTCWGWFPKQICCEMLNVLIVCNFLGWGLFWLCTYVFAEAQADILTT